MAQPQAPLNSWQVSHEPAANTVATITKAAGATGVRHVATGFVVSLAAGATAATGVVRWRLRDGASGAGTVLSAGVLNAAINVAVVVPRENLAIEGSPATAMTLEFDVAPGAANFESVTLEGYDEVTTI